MADLETVAGTKTLIPKSLTGATLTYAHLDLEAFRKLMIAKWGTTEGGVAYHEVQDSTNNASIHNAYDAVNTYLTAQGYSASDRTGKMYEFIAAVRNCIDA